MPTQASQTATATGVLNFPKPATDTLAVVQVSGTYTGLTFTFNGSLDATNFGALGAVRGDTLAPVTGSVSPANSATQIWKVPCEGAGTLQINVTALATGSATFQVNTYALVGVPLTATTSTQTSTLVNTTVTSASATAFQVGPNGSTNPVFNVDGSVGSQATGLNLQGKAAGGGVSLTTTSSGANEDLLVAPKGTGGVKITSTSTDALDVGPNGATNPSLKVNANTASAATGVSVTAAAAAGGVAVAAISSGANESLTVDAKGTGTVTLNGVGGTGAVQFGGAGSGNNATGLKVTPNAAGSGVDVTAVSTGGNEAMTLEAKGTSSLKLNATTGCTGPVQIGGAASGNNATGLTITPNAAGSGLALAVVSTGSNENLTENAKGSGTITIGGVSTGLISIGRGSTNVVVESSTKTTLSSGTSVTATAAQLLGGYVIVSGQTSATTLTTDTAANLDSAIPAVATGDCFFVTVYNANTSSGAITLAAGSSVTLKGTTALPISKAATLFFQRTGSGTWDCVSVVSA